jgi:hypothetical protein
MIPSANSRGRLLLGYVAFLFTALFASYYYARLRWSLNVVSPHDLLYKLLTDAADGPFQVRALVPWLVGVLEGGVGKPWLVRSAYDWFFLVETASTLVLLVAFGRYVSMLLKDRTLGFVMPFVLFSAMTFNFVYPDVVLPIQYPYYFPALLRFEKYYALYYPYDTPSIMFVALGLLLLYRKRMLLFYVVLALSSLNKEAAPLLLIFVFLATGLGRERPRTLALHITAQILVVSLVIMSIYAFYSADPMGVLPGLEVAENLSALSNPRAYPYLLSGFGFLLVPTFLCYRLIGDAFVRRSLLSAVPFAAAVFIWGRVDDLRSYGELIPVVGGGSVLVIREMYHRAASRLSRAEGPSGGPAVSAIKGLAADRRALVSLFVFLAMAAAFSYYYANLRWALDGLQPNGSIEVSLYGKADKVYQVRALVPWIVGFIEGSIARPWFFKSAYDWFWLVEMVSTFLLVVAFSHYASMLLRDRMLGFLMSFVLVYAMQFNFLFPRLGYPLEYPGYLPALKHYPYINLFYPFDTPSMLFITVGLILLYRRKWMPYYVLFTLATFNRESTCFLTLVYLFTALGRQRHGRVAMHCAMQLVIWVAVRYCLYQLYKDNPGQPIQYGWNVNLEMLSDPANYYFVMSTMGYLWLPVLLFYRHVRDDFTRKSLLVAVPYLAGLFSFGQVIELRDFVDLIPIVLPAFVLVLRERFEIDKGMLENRTG